MSNKLYLQAIKDLPKKWIHKSTDVVGITDGAVACNPNYAPMIYKSGAWKDIKPCSITEVNRFIRVD